MKKKVSLNATVTITINGVTKERDLRELYRLAPFYARSLENIFGFELSKEDEEELRMGRNAKVRRGGIHY
jgi:hypothetical protein